MTFNMDQTDHFAHVFVRENVAQGYCYDSACLFYLNLIIRETPDAHLRDQLYF